MATQKGPVIYRVRNKKTKLERDMPVTVYQHVKRNWDIIGQVVDGEVVQVNPSLPQQAASPQKGNSAVAIGRVEVPDEVLDSPDVPAAENEGGEENEGSEDHSVNDQPSDANSEVPQGETAPAESEAPAKPKGKPGRKPSAK